ncbi:hypothetical protein Tco_0702493 [Tanacetum coccineum]|uniref:Mitochondrial protein n=1 Tax=Tanacetum coccineum TaxID=301880 RepID=A0ABQ4XXG0_9ASTR
MVEPVHANDTPLPPGHSLGSSENSTRFPSPSDLANHISSSSEINGKKRGQFTIILLLAFSLNLHMMLTWWFPHKFSNPSQDFDAKLPTRRVHTVHPISQIIGDISSPVLTRGSLKKSKFGESALAGYVHDQQRNNHTDYLHSMQEEMQQFVHQEVWKLVPLPEGKTAIGTKWILKNKRDARVHDRVPSCIAASRPDIQVCSECFSRHQVTPFELSHLNAVKRIVKYLKGRNQN